MADIARKLRIVEQTFYRWKMQYGGLEASEVRELRQLREENARLKRLVADLSLDKVMLQDVAAKNGRRIAIPVGGALSAAGLLGQRATRL